MSGGVLARELVLVQIGDRVYFFCPSCSRYDCMTGGGYMAIIMVILRR